MKLTLKKALEIAYDKEGYEHCRNRSHGLGSMITVDGITKKARFAICPIIQFYPKPTFLFHSWQQFVKSSEIYFRQRGWWPERELCANSQRNKSEI